MELKKLTDELIAIREQARTDKNWLLSDEIRKELDTRNCFIFDGPTGQEVYHMTKPMTRDEMISIRKEMDFNFKTSWIAYMA